jgi:hypothetical protein
MLSVIPQQEQLTLMKWPVCILGCLLAASLYACASHEPTLPSIPVTSEGGRAPHSASTPFPLPKQTPNWGIVEKPKPWDFTSTGPDRTLCKPNQGPTYRVGPNQPYPEPHNVPWLRLLPCDTVLIYPSSKAYSDLTTSPNVDACIRLFGGSLRLQSPATTAGSCSTMAAGRT